MDVIMSVNQSSENSNTLEFFQEISFASRCGAIMPDCLLIDIFLSQPAKPLSI
jgi:hypothetical protein